MSAQTMMTAPSAVPRGIVTRERVMQMAHQMVDGLQGANPAAYYILNNRADVPALAAQIAWWLERHGIEIRE